MIFLTLALLTIVKITVFGQKEDEIRETICFIDSAPQFPGGQKELVKFIKANLKHLTGQPCAEGKVFVSFIVNVDGSVSDVEIARGFQEEFDNCAKDVIRKMPKWIPVIENGKRVKRRMTIPIFFR